MSLKLARVSAGLLLLGAVMLGAKASADEPDSVDPSGSWRWKSAYSGKIETLRLQREAGQRVRGQYVADGDPPVDLDSVSLDGDQLVFQMKLERDGAKIRVNAKAKLKGDQLQGVVQYEVEGGDKGEIPWKAERTVLAQDLVGQWRLELKAPDGLERRPLMTVSEKDGALNVQFADNGQTMDVSSAQVANNELLVKLQLQYGGDAVKITYVARPKGNAMTGVIQYEIAGNSGDFPFQGKRVE